MKQKTESVVLKWSKMITPQVKHLAVEKVSGEPLDFIAGQFISVHFEHQGQQLKRSYSVATVPGTSNLIEFAIAPVEGGAATELFFNMKEGDSVELSGPYGRFYLRDEDRPGRYILVATGTGVVPYLCMLPALEKRLLEDENLEIELFLGVQKPEDLLYGDEFIAMAERFERFHFHACYSREYPEKPKLHEKEGRVLAHFDSLTLNADTDIVYLCGNPDMVDDAFIYFKEQGFTPRSIRREKYISSK